MSFRALARTGIVAVAASGLFPACESDANPVAIYGAPCSPSDCGVTGGTSGSSSTGGSSGSNSTGGTSGTAGDAGEAGLGGEGGS